MHKSTVNSRINEHGNLTENNDFLFRTLQK